MPHIYPNGNDFTADVFVVHKNKVLLRMHDKYKIWLAVGGHIEIDEDPNEAAIREVKEEVGLDIVLSGKCSSSETRRLKFMFEGCKELMVPRRMNIHPINEHHNHISLVYFATSETDDVKPSGSDVSNEWRWFDMEDLEKNNLGIKESIRYYAVEALMELGK
jgi:ADP-ribose pyrophosphatase YjhB (NUDIX family)